MFVCLYVVMLLFCYVLVEQDRNLCVHALVPIGELREEATWTFPLPVPFL